MLKVNHRFDVLALRLKAAKVAGKLPKHLTIHHSPIAPQPKRKADK